MTIYRLYAENGHRAGFWIQHRSWENACAQVVTIAGQDFGHLPGVPPTYGNAVVVVTTFDVRSGRKLEVNAILPNPDDRHFSRIAEPSWCHQPAHFFAKPRGADQQRSDHGTAAHAG